MKKIINPQFKETAEQRRFRQTYMIRIHAAYRFHESLGLMDLGEDRKISLQDIYVPLRFSGKELDEGRDWEEQGDTHSIIEILDNSRHIVLSGRPGSGKTTISRMIINLLSTRGLTNLAEHCGRRIPLYFKLRDYNMKGITSAGDLLDSFIKTQGAVLRFEISKEYLKFYLKQGWCFLIFDGVDEVGGLENRLKIRRFILEYFTKLNRENYLLVTSRPSGLGNASFSRAITKEESEVLKNWLSLFYVDSFNKSQAQEFSTKWFDLREENPETIKNKANEFIHDIEKIKSLSVLKRRPVFITMMAHIHTTKSKLPHSRAMAYEYMVQAYIEILDNTRRLHKTMYKAEEFIEWSFEDKIRLLQCIAYRFHTAEKKGKGDSLLVVEKKRLLIMIEGIINDNRERWETIRPDHAQQLLKFYLTRTGLLHEPEEGGVQFSHLSFQEYLTARFIYRKLIEENLFKAFLVIKKEIIPRLNQEHWQEVILLFFSLNKEATNDILEMMEKESDTQPGGKMYESFHTLILKMLDSDEYGIKDSEMDHWVKKVIDFIVRINSGFKKVIPKKKNFRRKEAAINQIDNFFSSTERKSKIESAKKYLNEVFDENYEIVQNNFTNKVAKNYLENILYFVLYKEDFSKSFKSKIANALPVLLNRAKYDTQYLACGELFTYYFNEYAEPVSKIYTIDESILCRDFVSISVFSQFSKEDPKKNWMNQILEWEWVIENLYSFSSLNNVVLKKTDLRERKATGKGINIKNYLDLLDKAEHAFWKKNWINLLWFSHDSGLKNAVKRINSRKLSKLISHRYISLSDHEPSKATISKLIDYDLIPDIFNKIGRIDKNYSLIIYKLRTILSIILAAFSDVEFNKKYRKIENPWKNYNELKVFYDLLCNPESIYDYLSQNSRVDIEKEAFIAQYEEYDQKPYSMRNMVKDILNGGEENFPTLSSEEALEKSIKLINEGLEFAEKHIKKKLKK
jgi:hypothetical protein